MALEPHPLHGDHAVLQRGVPIPIRGTDRPGAMIRVSFAGAVSTARADREGRWSATLPPMAAEARGRELVMEGTTRVVRTNVVVGDVWLCSGQSNMEWALGACDTPDVVRAADLPLVRHFGVGMRFAATPHVGVRGEWKPCVPGTAAEFTAVGFHFARRVAAETGIPVGLLRSAVGGTNIECWMARETLLGTPALEPFARRMRDSWQRYQAALRAARPTFDAWSKRAREAEAAGREVPQPPEWPPFPYGEQAFDPRCVTLHNGMIAPIAFQPLRGALWYQGENNAGGPADGDQYIEKTKALIADWRRWFRRDLPFYYVQLANWQAPNPDPAGGDGWAEFRDAQRRALAITGTGMAVACDIGDAGDIHPRNKEDVGERLALWALRDVHGRRLESSGPLLAGFAAEGDRIRVRFDHADSGLMAGRRPRRGPSLPDPGADIAHVAVAGEDRRWRWARTRIEGSTLLVGHPAISRPVAVRYAYAMNPAAANLCNRDGLPASPFRTDRW